MRARWWNRVPCLFGWHRWFLDEPRRRAKCVLCGEEFYA